MGLALGLDLLAQSGDELGCAVPGLKVNAPFWSAFPTLFAHRTPMFGARSGTIVAALTRGRTGPQDEVARGAFGTTSGPSSNRALGWVASGRFASDTRGRAGRGQERIDPPLPQQRARLARLSAGNVVAPRKWTIRTGAESS